VVYDSLWRNTAAIARAVTEGIGPKARTLSTAEALGAALPPPTSPWQTPPCWALPFVPKKMRESIGSRTPRPPNNSLQLTRPARRKPGVPCPPGCAIMSEPKPEPPRYGTHGLPRRLPFPDLPSLSDDPGVIRHPVDFPEAAVPTRSPLPLLLLLLLASCAPHPQAPPPPTLEAAITTTVAASPPPAPTATPDLAMDWVPYSDLATGFSLLRPPDWFVYPAIPALPATTVLASFDLINAPPLEGDIPAGQAKVDLSVAPSPIPSDVESVVWIRTYLLSPEASEISESSLTLGSHQGIRLDYIAFATRHIAIFIPLADKLYSVQIYAAPDCPGAVLDAFIASIRLAPDAQA